MKKVVISILLIFSIPMLFGIKSSLAILLFGSVTLLCLWVNTKAREKHTFTPKKKERLLLNHWGEFVKPNELHDINEIPYDPKRSIGTEDS